MSRRRSTSRRRRTQEEPEPETQEEPESETDEEYPLYDYESGYETEEEEDGNITNRAKLSKWLSKGVTGDERDETRDTRQRWARIPGNIKIALLIYVTSQIGRNWTLEDQKLAMHDIVKDYHSRRNALNNKYGHAIGDKHSPCCTTCGRTLCGKLCNGKNYCKQCKRSYSTSGFYFVEDEYEDEKMECKPPKREGGYKRTRRRRNKNRKKRTKKRARGKRRRKSSKRKRGRKR